MAEQVGEIFLIVSEMFCYITHFQIFCAVKTDVFNDVKINLFGRRTGTISCIKFPIKLTADSHL